MTGRLERQIRREVRKARRRELVEDVLFAACAVAMVTVGYVWMLIVGGTYGF